TRHCNASHHELGTHPAALADVVAFFQKRLLSKAHGR
ncbi:MAG: alpha/beta hydrolase, partial [Caballeronia sp.]|nr:alpha/beta hydrolase [Caballeronia sp.]